MNLAPKLLADLLMQSPAFRKIALAEPSDSSGAGTDNSMADKVREMVSKVEPGHESAPLGEKDGRQALERESRRLAPKPCGGPEMQMAKMLLGPTKEAAGPISPDEAGQVSPEVLARLKSFGSKAEGQYEHEPSRSWADTSNAALIEAPGGLAGGVMSGLADALSGAMVPGGIMQPLVAGGIEQAAEQIPQAARQATHPMPTAPVTVPGTPAWESENVPELKQPGGDKKKPGSESARKPAKDEKPSEKRGSPLLRVYEKVAVGYNTKPIEPPKPDTPKSSRSAGASMAQQALKKDKPGGKALTMKDVHKLTENVKKSGEAAKLANMLLGPQGPSLEEAIQQIYGPQPMPEPVPEPSPGLFGMDLGDLASTPEGIDASIAELEVMRALQTAQQARELAQQPPEEEKSTGAAKKAAKMLLGKQPSVLGGKYKQVHKGQPSKRALTGVTDEDRGIAKDAMGLEQLALPGALAAMGGAYGATSDAGPLQGAAGGAMGALGGGAAGALGGGVLGSLAAEQLAAALLGKGMRSQVAGQLGGLQGLVMGGLGGAALGAQAGTKQANAQVLALQKLLGGLAKGPVGQEVRQAVVNPFLRGQGEFMAGSGQAVSDMMREYLGRFQPTQGLAQRLTQRPISDAAVTLGAGGLGGLTYANLMQEFMPSE